MTVDTLLWLLIRDVVPLVFPVTMNNAYMISISLSLLCLLYLHNEKWTKFVLQMYKDGIPYSFIRV